jgi:hypothetical protein
MSADNTSIHSRPACDPLFVLVSAVAFLLYALGVFTLDQARSPGWGLEAAAPLPSAISSLVYGTPVGAIDENVMVEVNRPNVQKGMATAASGFVPRGRLIPYTPDGIGSGSVLFATLALKMFGKNVAALVRFFLLFEGLSVLAFALRFRDQRLFFIPLYFFVFTVMLITPLCASLDEIMDTPIGGQRFFVAAAFLPTMHIIFELMDEPPGKFDRRTALSNNLLFLVQCILLFATLLVRSAASYVLGGIILAAVFRIYRDRKAHRNSLDLLSKTAIFSSALVFWIVVVAQTLPAFVESGRALGNVWHRAFVSFAQHPDWPFGNLHDIYKCPVYSQVGLSREGSPDSNGFCIWAADPRNAGASPSDLRYTYFGGDSEKAVRSAYFYVLTHYPRQTFELYAFVKTQGIFSTVKASLDFLLDVFDTQAPRRVVVIVAIQCALFGYAVFLFSRKGSSFLTTQFLILATLFVLSIAPRYVAWASVDTAFDLFFLLYSCLVLALLLAVSFVINLVTSSKAPPLTAS